MTYWLLCSVCAALCVQCQKEDGTLAMDIKVKGTVIDATTNLPIPFARVALMENDFSQGMFATTTTVKKVDTADAQGNFEFKHPRLPKCTYDLNARATNYIEKNEEVEVKQPTLFTKKTQLNLTPKAWIKVHVKQTSPYDPNNAYSAVVDGVTTPGGGGSFPIIDRTFVINKEYPGNSKVDIRASLYVNSTRIKTFQVPVTTVAFDTVFVYVEF
jgi:hypothetical protein